MKAEIKFMDKKQLIIESAIMVFAREGLEKGKIADIAKEAGIGKGTIYEYFRSKEEIFQAIEQSVFIDFNSVFDQLDALDISPTEKLKTIMTQGIDALMDMGDALLIITEFWAQAGRGYLHNSNQARFVEYYEKYRLGIESILTEGIQSGDFRDMNREGVARLFMAFLDGLVWQFVMMNNPEKINKIKDETIESFIRGILK